MSHKAFDSELREIIQEENSLIEFSDGRVWRVKNREVVWNKLGSRLYDRDLDAVKELAIKVLTERDPKFELDPDKRFYANLSDKKLTHSSEIREGLAETLALLGNRFEALSNCSPGKPKMTAVLAVREIFANSDWQLWGSLNHLLPTLAEAAPKEFLRAVESALHDPAGPFVELFRQEGGDSISGNNYLTGLLWALEALAWDEDLLANVCLVLAELAEQDPGGSWANRPDHSISTILLPWYPQTFATVERRFSAIKSIVKDSPKVAWKVLISLLPNGMSNSSGSYKSRWLNPIPDDWRPKVTGEEHFEQVNYYSQIAAEMAAEDFERLKELVTNLDNLTKDPFEAVLETLSSDQIGDLDTNHKSELWQILTKFSNKHRRFSDAKWALPTEQLTNVERVTAFLQPDDPSQLYLRLFTLNDIDLYEYNDSYEENQEKLLEKRKQAVKEILDQGHLHALLKFVRAVESPHHVGRATAELDSVELDNQLLPKFLSPSEEATSMFAANYVFHRFLGTGDAWLDGLDRQEWKTSQVCALLKFLPFDQPVWIRLEDWLGEAKNNYWCEVNVNPYQANSDLEGAIEKLLEYNRPNAAIECLSCQLHKQQLNNVDQVVRSLLGSLSAGESVRGISQYNIVELVSFLQKLDSVPEQDLASIEWGFLRLLQSYNKATPMLLMKKLATDPEFFCEVIRMIYKSRNEGAETKQVDENRKKRAGHAWRLMHEWNQPPGLSLGEEFDEQGFTNWLQRVQEISTESGHFEVAMINVGEVLFYTPMDHDGFWINRVVAENLNQRNAEKMRDGFRTQIYNSRGSHWVDPTGAPERKLADEWRAKADVTDREGFARFASVLREVSEGYDYEAEIVVREHADR